MICGARETLIKCIVIKKLLPECAPHCTAIALQFAMIGGRGFQSESADNQVHTIDYLGAAQIGYYSISY